MAEYDVLSKKNQINFIHDKLEKKAKDIESFYNELQDINHWDYEDMRCE